MRVRHRSHASSHIVRYPLRTLPLRCGDHWQRGDLRLERVVPVERASAAVLCVPAVVVRPTAHERAAFHSLHHAAAVRAQLAVTGLARLVQPQRLVRRKHVLHRIQKRRGQALLLPQ